MAESTTLARPYAKAVFQLAKASGDYTAWSEILQVLALLVQDKQVVALIADPGLAAEKKVDLLVNCGVKLFADSAKELVQLLVANGRLLLAAEIYALYEQYRAAEEHTLAVDVCLATAASAEEKEMLQAAVSKYFNRRAIISWRQDPSLIGGLVVKAEDKVFDGSIRAQLQALHTELISA